MAVSFWQWERTNRRQTAFLVGIFVIFFCLLGAGLDFVFGNLRITPEGLSGFPFLTIAALIVALVQTVVSYYGGANLILASVHAVELQPDSNRHKVVLDVIEEMRLAARMPPIKAYVMADPAPNAFATGRDPQHSVICVTQGLIDMMDREQLQGVIGHEMAHIRDYDIRTMMMIAVLVGGIAMLADFLARWMWFDGFGERERRRDNDQGQAGILIALAVFVLAAISPILCQLLAMAVARQREYLADAGSVEFTRNPRALLRALEQIAAHESPLKNASRGTAHLFIVNPREGLREDDREGFFDNLFSTHPPLPRRIQRLRAMLDAPADAASPPTSA
ncbi:MAG TPA: M48 family metallopeptidase [Candidatus Binataceae bacterium]|nr:M48 family metallopeptidase [Candidatus Binataceae bacterium]